MASNKEGRVMGVVLISPSKEKMNMVIRIYFQASKNEVEYEYVMVGLRAARDARTTRIIIYSDSQLVIQQVKGSYEAERKY